MANTTTDRIKAAGSQDTKAAAYLTELEPCNPYFIRIALCSAKGEGPLKVED